jgi:hypothetical protein
MFSKKLTQRSLVFSLVACMFFAFSLQAQQFDYPDAWGDDGLQVLQQDRSGVAINYSISSFAIFEEEINGRQMQNILLPGNILPNDEGMPNLPGVSRYIAIPNGSKAVLKITDYRTEKIKNVEIAPAPRIPFENEDGLHFEKNAKVYASNEYYPADPFQLSEVTSIRGVESVMLGITPYQYNPVTKELIVYRDIAFEVTFEGGDGNFGEDRLRSRWWDPIHQDALLNSAMLPEIDYNRQRNEAMTRNGSGCEYLIVVPNAPEFYQWADSIKQFRQKQGILTDIVTLDEIGGTSAAQVKNYFTQAYSTWDIPPAAVLLLADYGSNANNSITSPIYNNYCVSDNMFADMTNNHMPDVVFARITANNASQLQTMVTKFINYERNPPTNPGFYNNPITALGWQTERWFQICSETVGGFWRNQGKDPVRVNDIYSGTPGSIWSTATNTATVVDYFGPNGLGYIPAAPTELGGWTGGNASMVNNAINNGAFMLQHRDHGYTGGWGEPAYGNNNISALYNTDLTFVFSINCLTGKYNISGESFTEKFHRHTSGGNNSGALGLIAASEVSYSFVNDTYVWGMFDNMYPEYLPDYGMPVEERGLLPAYANSAGKYFLQQSSWPYNVNNKQVTYHLFHHHGGAFLNVYSEVPQQLSVVHGNTLISGETVFNVTADAGSFIALTVNGEIIGTAEGTGQPVAIEILPQMPPNNLMVTVTKQNYYRHESVAEIIAPDGPYVVLDSFEIDDSAGNNNGLMDYGETISVNMTLKNVGVDMAENIIAQLASQDEYVEIVNATADFGEIEPDGLVTLNAAFTLNVLPEIPNNHTVMFEVSASDGTDAWVSTFNVKGHAPAVEITEVVVEDTEGNDNGRLDPGETADIIITVENAGGADVYELSAAIESLTPFILINSDGLTYDVMPHGESMDITFNITVSPAVPVGSMIGMDFGLMSSLYEFEETINLKVGQIVEDFEAGNFSAFEWEFEGSADWMVTPSGVYEGSYSARSGYITHSQMSTMKLTMNIPEADVISFYYKVSSESSYDFLHFYIDGVHKDSWSGVVPWAKVTYDVQPGERTFKWIYQKDQNTSSGNDCAWVDYIEFPAPIEENLVAWAGFDAEMCQGEELQLSGHASNYEDLLWETSGDGTFSDPAIINPVYTPGEMDYQAENVVLTLTAEDGDETVSDSMSLDLMPLPATCALPEGETTLCIGTEYEIYSTAAAANTEDYIWVLSPEEAGTIAYEGTTATVNWNPEWTGMAQLSVLGVNDCGEGELSEALEISVTDYPEVPQMPTGETDICEGEVTGYETTGGLYDVAYYWELLPAEAGTITFDGMSAEVDWADGFSGDAAIHVKTMNVCGESDYSEALTIGINPKPAAAPAIEGKDNVCFGNVETYSIEDIAFAATCEWMIEPQEAGTVTEDGSLCQITFGEDYEGVATLKVRGVNDCGHGDWSEAFEVLIEDCTGIDDKAQTAFSLYPNPSNGNFTISLNTQDVLSVRIITASGNLVYNEQNVEVNGAFTKMINTSGLAQGVYYLSVTGSQTNITEKIIIQK